MTPRELRRINLELAKYVASILELECRVDEYREAIDSTQITIDSQKKKEEELKAKLAEAIKASA